MTATPTRPVLHYHGGKWRLAPWIISHFPAHRVYVEPFGGAASVLMQKPRAYAEVYNDAWDTVVDVFRVLRDPDQARELERRLRLTPFARVEFASVTDAALAATPDPIERARMTMLRSFAGFGSASTNGAHATGFRATSNRSGTTPAHDWMHFPDCIRAFTARLAGVVIEDRDAADVMRQHDTPDTLHYVDPPYVQSTRNMRRGNAAYAYELTDADHEQLAEVLHGLSGMVVLSGYRSDLYAALYPDWQVVERGHLADGARPRVECLWLNRHAAERSPAQYLPLGGAA